jgi:hypothetical protein
VKKLYVHECSDDVEHPADNRQQWLALSYYEDDPSDAVAFSPLYDYNDKIPSGVFDLFNSIVAVAELEAENAALRQQVAAANAKVAELTDKLRSEGYDV